MISNKKLRIGILMDSLKTNSSLTNLVKSLKKNENFDIILLQNNLNKVNFLTRIRTKIFHEGFFRFISIAFFNIISKLEDFILKKLDKKFSADSQNLYIKKDYFLDVLEINPIFYKKFFVKYHQSDLKRIKKLNLDFILRGNGSGIFKGEILHSSKYGLISIHHGDNTWNRGGPPGFWEVYLSKRKTGFIIQICTEKLDDGNVIFRGETATLSTYLKNRVNLQQVSYPFFEYVFEYVFKNQKLPESDKKDTSSSKLYKTPKFSISVNYTLKILFFYLSKIIKRLVLRKKQIWNVGFQKNSWRNLDLKDISEIKNPKNRFLADPFIFTKNSQTAIFVEDFSFKTKKGSISSVLIKDGEINKPLKIIDENFHLSFPFIFEYNDNLYMLPESRHDRSLRIYECVDFPFNWKFSHKIMDNIDAVDSIIFYKDPYWWLMTNIGDKNSLDFSSKSYLFYSNSPISTNWKAHKKNPVIFSSDHSRNGGLIIEKNKIFRVRQEYGFSQYGKQVSLSEIEILTPDDFSEKFVLEIKPSSLNRVKGVHHLSTDGNFSVIDLVREK